MDYISKIRVVEDFPKAGISFKDITTLIKDGDDFVSAIDDIAALVGETDLIAGPEARGFIFGTAAAYKLGCGFVPIRKKGKLPAETIAWEYDLEYGIDCLEIHADAVKPGSRVVLVDDLLATGGTLAASAKLIEKAGGTVTGIVVLIELTELGGRQLLKDYRTEALATYPF